MTESLVYRPEPIKPVHYTEEEMALFGATYAKGCDPTEIKLAAAVASQLGFSLLARQVHAIKRWDGQLRREVLTMIVGIDGFRAQADRTGLWDGVSEPEYLTAEGTWVKDWLDPQQHPIACRVNVYRRGWNVPRVGKAYWAERAQYIRDKQTGKERLSSQWASQPLTMLAKCAEVAGLRGAFPSHLGGVYAPEEMGAEDEIEGQARVVVQQAPSLAPPSPPVSEKRAPGRPRKAPAPAPENGSGSVTAAPPTSPRKEAVDEFFRVVTEFDAGPDKETTRANVVNRLQHLAAHEFIAVETSSLDPTQSGILNWLEALSPEQILAVTAVYREDAEGERKLLEGGGETAADPASEAVEGMFAGLPQ